MLRIIKSKIKKNSFLYENYRDIRYWFNKSFISDETYIKWSFRKKMHRSLNLTSPTNYNDKIQWLKLYWRDDFASLCADKYEVRKVIKEEIGEEYLNDIIGIYNDVNEIAIDKLPSKFVIKGTHGSGFNLICDNKEKLDWAKAVKKMKRWLRKDYFWNSREWVYKELTPKVIVEKYLEDSDGNVPKDYKIFCFHGEPHFIEVDVDRFSDHKRNIYNLDWELLDTELQYPNDTKKIIPRPETLTEMLKLSRILSRNFPHVRVDFYNLEGKIIFGELTFFHESGYGKFSPVEREKEWGQLIDLSLVKGNSERIN